MSRPFHITSVGVRPPVPGATARRLPGCAAALRPYRGYSCSRAGRGRSAVLLRPSSAASTTPRRPQVTALCGITVAYAKRIERGEHEASADVLAHGAAT